MNNQAHLDDTAEWLNYLQPEGLVVGANVLRERELSPIRQTPLDSEAAAHALDLVDPKTGEPGRVDREFVLTHPWRFFETVLGWSAKLVAGAPGGPEIDADLARTVPEHGTHLAPDLALLWNGAAEDGVPAQALVALHPDLDADARGAFGAGEWEASPHARLERLVRETGVGVGILVARGVLRLIYAPRGETAGWLTFPLAPLGRVEGRPMLAGLKLCLGRGALFTGAPDARLRALLKASREAQDKVSEKLSGQVLGALHELLRGLHRADPDQIETLAEKEPHHLYEGLLTCLMRLVFLLYAEDRDLLPSSTDAKLRALWDDGYSVRTLYARLLTDEALNPDTMDERRGGWGQLLAVFRLIHDGHPGWIARRGGKLFDPDAFPFLEGRMSGGDRTDARVLPVSDGTILRILHGLMTIEAKSLQGAKIRERLSYRSLDVESIGSVYETVMGFTADRATERMVALRDEKKLPTFIGLDTLLAQKPADRAKWLKDRSVRLSTKQAAGVKAAADEAALLEAFGSLVDERVLPRGMPIGGGAPYLQPTEERRRSGSHYTPRSLTEPIVRHALEPAFERIGSQAGPEAVLALRVLDLACGSGAFLVEACRQLGARLEQAWDMHPAEKPPIPLDEDAATHARRLVAQKCLYGVDKNPMAVDLARLSLWLATLAREHEFSFLDHALKAGDSLVGLTRKEIQAVHWDAAKPGLPLFRSVIEEKVRKALEGREAIRNAGDDATLAIQTARHRRVEDEVEGARIVGDAVIAAFFAADKPRAKEQERAKVESLLTGSTNGDWDELRAAAKRFRHEHGWRPFHWEIEFPEVFTRDNPGFDAIVGNPPFLGGSKISTTNGVSYLDWLLSHKARAHGNADIVAHFFRVGFLLLRNDGCFGLIATNTIGQGDTRSTGLHWICSNGGQIYRAVRRLKWPGLATVVVSVIHSMRGEWGGEKQLNDRYVSSVNAFLVEGPNVGDPFGLGANRQKSFLGVKVYGQGFLFDDGDKSGLASSIDSMHQLIRTNTSNADRIMQYIGGEDINSDPLHSSKRYVINFGQMSLEEAEIWPDLTDIVRQKVKPQRDLLRSDTGPGAHGKKWWWQFQHPRAPLYRAISNLDRVLAISQVSPHLSFALIGAKAVFSHSLVIIGKQGYSDLCTLQSRIHEIWARFFSSTLEDRLRYAPSDCFETFPFPPSYETDPILEAAGQAYHDHRAALMVEADEGMTKTYNRFHDAGERRPAIQRLRELHDEMDRVVLRAYGWDDLADALQPVFLTLETEDDHTYQGRYFWPAEGRDLVLSRLLALNAERHAEEVAAGIAPARGKRVRADEDGESELDFA